MTPSSAVPARSPSLVATVGADGPHPCARHPPWPVDVERHRPLAGPRRRPAQRARPLAGRVRGSGVAGRRRDLVERPGAGAGTAEIIAAAIGLPLRPDARFRERDAGDWTGLTRDEIEAGWPRYLADHRRPTGFEHDSEVLARILDGLADVHEAHPGGMVLIVSHGGVLRAMERYCHDVDRAFPNLGGRFFDLDGPNDELSSSPPGPRLFPLAEDQATFTTTP